MAWLTSIIKFYSVFVGFVNIMAAKMKISESGTCVMSNDCIPTKYDPIFKHMRRKDLQRKYIDKHDCFMSCGRVYVTLADRIVDAVTGTLYTLSGQCLSHDVDLIVDMSDVNRDKETIVEFVLGKY